MSFRWLQKSPLKSDSELLQLTTILIQRGGQLLEAGNSTLVWFFKFPEFCGSWLMLKDHVNVINVFLSSPSMTLMTSPFLLFVIMNVRLNLLCEMTASSLQAE